MASLVVPAMLLTIDLSSPTIAFTKLLFPTFGLPITQNFILLSSKSFFSYGKKSFVIVSNSSLNPKLCSPLIGIILSNPSS